MATTKDDRIYVRVSSEIKEDFETIAEYRGLKTSALLHSLIVKTIHDTKRENPEVFAKQESPRLRAKTLDEIKRKKKKPSGKSEGTK